MLAFQSWCDAHIRAPAQRQWFASQMQAMAAGPMGFAAASSTLTANAAQTPANTLPEQEDAYGVQEADIDGDPLAPLPGETDEEWQERHGFYHLTPGAVKIFDASRKFKAERALEQAQEDARALEEEEGHTNQASNWALPAGARDPSDASPEDDDEIWHSRSGVRAPTKESNAAQSSTIRDRQPPAEPAYKAPPGQGKGTRAVKRKRKAAFEASQAAAAAAASSATSSPAAAGSRVQSQSSRASHPSELELLRERALQAKRLRPA